MKLSDGLSETPVAPVAVVALVAPVALVFIIYSEIRLQI